MITKLQEWLKSRFQDDEDSQQPEPLQPTRSRHRDPRPPRPAARWRVARRT